MILLLLLLLLQGAVVAIEHPERRIFGLQYHPEVMHTEQGTDTIRHFLLDIAGLKADWTMAEVLETQLKLIEQQVGVLNMFVASNRYMSYMFVCAGQQRWGGTLHEHG